MPGTSPATPASPSGCGSARWKTGVRPPRPGWPSDVHAIQAVAAAWVAPAPGPRVRAAYEQILDARHALHEVTGRRLDRLVLEEQDEVARALGLPDGDALLRMLAGAGRVVA